MKNRRRYGGEQRGGAGNHGELVSWTDHVVEAQKARGRGEEEEGPVSVLRGARTQGL